MAFKLLTYALSDLLCLHPYTYQQASCPAFGVIGGHWGVCIMGGHHAYWNGRRRLYTGLMPGEPHQQNLGWLFSTVLWHYGVRDMQSLDFTNEGDHSGHWHVQSSQWASYPIGCHGGNWGASWVGIVSIGRGPVLEVQYWTHH